MTEAEWLACGAPGRMLNYLGRRARARKCRLYACGACRLIWHLIRDERSREAVDVAERFADQRVSRRELAAARAIAYEARYLSGVAAWSATNEVARVAAEWIGVWVKDVGGEAVAGLPGLLRDIFGNPFRPVAFGSSWRTSSAISLAEGMYESRDFSAVPILADALQDAGCESAEVLEHCRGGGPHVRGCWVVDLVLGKE